MSLIILFPYALVKKLVDIVDKVKVDASTSDPVREWAAGAFSFVRTALDKAGQIGQHMTKIHGRTSTTSTTVRTSKAGFSDDVGD